MSAAAPRTLHIHQRLLGKNAEIAAANRTRFRQHGLLTLNILSSPGAGKTSLLERMLADRFAGGRVGVIVGDLATDNDARRLFRFSPHIVQIATGSICHLEADMISRAAESLPLDELDMLIIENVGNLVCPTGFDLGEDVRVVLVSLTEGEDKPLKYPGAFRSAHAVIVSKLDLLPHLDVDYELLRSNLRAVTPRAEIFPISTKTNDGFEAWYRYLESRRQNGSRD